jgi:hypothetical protein
MRIWVAVMPGADAVAAPEDEDEDDELPQPRYHRGGHCDGGDGGCAQPV